MVCTSTRKVFLRWIWELSADSEAASFLLSTGKYSEQHESNQEHPVEQNEHGSSGHQQTSQAFLYETAAQQEFQPSHQSGYQLGGHHSGGNQQSYELVRRQSGDHQNQQSAYQGHQPAGFQLSAHQQAHQLGGFKPNGYHAMNLPVDSYRKH